MHKFLIYNCNTALKHKNVKTRIATRFTIRELFTKLSNISRTIY